MRVERERGAGPVVTGFSQGGFKVETDDFLGVYRALLIWPDGSSEWAPPPLEALTPDALGTLLTITPRPEFLLLGTGPTMQRPPPSFVRGCEALGIGVEAMDSRAAARAWAVLRGETRWVVGALYPL
jgi:uncharacterized protein